MKKFLLALLLSASAYAQTAGTVYQATTSTGATVPGSPFPTLSAATTAETLAGPGTYTNLPFTTTAGTATQFVVACTASPSGATLLPPSTATLCDAKGNSWGIVNGVVTLNGKADPTTHLVIELAYVNGTIWQESTAATPARWWGTTVAPAVWQPAGGTLTSPLPVVVTPPPPPPPPTGTSRPSYNTGNGLYVLNGELYDSNGVQFTIRGVDRAHYDIVPTGLPLTHANATRLFVGTQYGASVASLVNDVQTQIINNKEVAIVTSPATTSGTSTSCSNDPTVLNSVVATWVSTAASWTPLNKHMILNIANEWGPKNSTVWRDSYITAIGQMRAAGYLGPLMIDSGFCGQDISDLLNYSTAVEQADPQHNIVFSLHVYGMAGIYPPGSTIAQVTPMLQQLAALSKTNGAVYVVGEFGPGRGIGPSPTDLSPLDLISAMDANGIGWAAWAWDDVDLSGCMADDKWFSMTYNCGTYTGLASQLTIFGNQLLPKLSTAVAATDF